MSKRAASTLRLVLTGSLVCALGLVASASEAKGRAPKAESGPATWCAPGVETLPGGACYLDGKVTTSRRTLVIFLHGAIAKGTTWQHNHQRDVRKLAEGNHVDVIFPRAPESSVGFVWPGSLEQQEKVEQSLIDGWMTGKRELERRAGRPYDDVFVMGFSSGAYFASSLAMRGRAPVDGYAAFAGGQATAARPNAVDHFAPVFVGVCSKDETSAAHSRAFAGALTAANIPRSVNVQPVGHGLSHVHFAYALTYLRHMAHGHQA